MITISQKGDFKSTTLMLNNAKNRKYLRKLDKFGRMGVDALREATPKDTGLTSESWSYEIHNSVSGLYEIVWSNSNVNKGLYIAVLIQYGHGLRGGGWVQGRDYINPAMRPIFDKIAEEAWKEMLT